MRIAAHIIVAVAQAISLVQASNLFSDVHHESDIGSHTRYHLMKGQSQVAHDEMKLRGDEVEKKATRASKAKQKVTDQHIGSKARQKNDRTKKSNAKVNGKAHKGKMKTSAKQKTKAKTKGKTSSQLNKKNNQSSKGTESGNVKDNPPAKAKANKKNETNKKKKQSTDRRPVTNRQPVAPPTEQNLPPPNLSSQSQCFSLGIYDSIDNDIAIIKNNILTDQERSHFLGGIVRMTAHDFMDYDRNDPENTMGMDGCFDQDNPSNVGLETIWCQTCALRILYRDKYSHISRSDFWVAAANAVIRQTSIDNVLDLKETFRWGRKDRDTCPGSGDRLPQSSGCDQVEDVFLGRMGLSWKDAVALLGAHTLGKGGAGFSGHDGTWSSSDKDAQIFDKQYYEAFFTESWRPRNMGHENQDWTTGIGNRMMLNTDMCLVYDIDEYVERGISCCAGQNQCINVEAVIHRCPMYASLSQRSGATEAVREMLGGSVISKNNAPFYIAFAKAWGKATTLGMNDLFPLMDSCNGVK